MTKRILFLAETAGRLGSSVFLLDFLAWIKEKRLAECSLLLAAPGELLNDFSALADTTILLPDGEATPEAYARATPTLARLRAQPFDLIFANTASATPLLELVARPGQPVLAHVMEGAYSLRHVLGIDMFERLKRHAPLFVAASSSIQCELIEEFHLPPERVRLVPCATRLPQPRERREHEGFVVLAAGTLAWRKGPDIFLQLAAEMKRLAPELDARFLWAGRPIEQGIEERLAYDARQSGVAERVTFLGEVADMPELYAGGDLFVLSSREEPLGLVCVEAAAMGLPVLCFKEAGAAADFVGDDAGCAIPYLAVGEMAKAAVMLAGDPKLRQRMGQTGRKRAQELHDMQAQAPIMWQAMETLF